MLGFFEIKGHRVTGFGLRVIIAPNIFSAFQ